MRAGFLYCLVATLLLLLAGSTAEAEGAEQDVQQLRDDALAKLPKAVEKLRVQELQQLLTERGAQTHCRHHFCAWSSPAHAPVLRF